MTVKKKANHEDKGEKKKNHGEILEELVSMIKREDDPLPLDHFKETLADKETARAILAAHGNNYSLLHGVCFNKYVTLDIVKWLVDLYPEAVRHQSHHGLTPLGRACLHADISLDIVEYLIDLYPEALSLLSWNGKTPLARVIHNADYAPMRMDLLRCIISKAPETVRIPVGLSDDDTTTVVHLACEKHYATLEAVRLLVEQWPESVSRRAKGELPLHCVLGGMDRKIPVDLVQYILECHPAAISERREGGYNACLPLHMACRSGQSLDVIELLGEAYPEACGEEDGALLNLPLHHYCLSHGGALDIETLRYLVRKCPAAPRTYNANGFLPLLYASGSSLEVIQYLLECNPDSIQDELCFHAVAQKGRMEVLQHFVDLYPEGARTISRAGTILHGLSNTGSGTMTMERVRFLYSLYPEAVKMTGSAGHLPLHLFCFDYRGSSPSGDVLQFLLAKHPAAAKAQDNSGCLPLHMIFQLRPPSDDDGFVEVEKRLLSVYKQAVEVLDEEGRLPIHHACEWGFGVRALKPLVNLYPSSVRVVSAKHGLPIHQAAKCGWATLSTIQYLVSCSRESLNTFVPGLGYPLHCASRDGDKEVFEYLLSMKLNAPNALHALFRHHDIPDKATIAERILDDYKGHLNNRDSQGAAPLHAAVASNVGSETIQRLLELDPAALQLRDKYDALPLHYALRNKDPSSVVDLLITEYPDAARIADKSGCFPLHVASRHGASLEVMKRLLEIYPESISSVDQRGECALHKACRGGHLELIELLAERNAPSVRQPNSDGMVPALLLCQASGKQESLLDELEELGTLWKLLRMNPQAILVP